MFLSVIASFLLVDHFEGKLRAFIILTFIFAITFFSVGVPYYYYVEPDYIESLKFDNSGVLFDIPIPLSFPLYAALDNREGEGYTIQYYQLKLFPFVFQESMVKSQATSVHAYLTWGDYILYFSFFLLVNIAGTAIGYWIGKGTIRSTLVKMRQKIKRNPAQKNDPDALIYIFGKPERLIV